MNRRAALEAAIEADPYDTRAYAVYGDCLQELGDPRGELIALQLSHANDPDRGLEAAEHALLERHPAMLPPAPARLRWSCGFVRRAEVAPAHLTTLLDHPSARFLVELAIYAGDLRPAIDALARHVRPALRALAIGADRPPEVPEDLAEMLEPFHDPEPSLDLVWPCVPDLERLRVLAHNVTFTRLELPRLVELELRPMLAEPLVAALADASWPMLERFDLGLGMVSWSPPVATHLSRFLLEAPPPKLVHLGLRGVQRLLFEALAEPRDLAAALGRLRSLDLRRNLLDDADVDLLVKSAIRLDRLDVSRNQLTPDAIARLSAVATTVIAEHQYSPADAPIEGLYDY